MAVWKQIFQWGSQGMFKYVIKNAARVNYYSISAFVSPVLLGIKSELYFAEYNTIARKILGGFQ